MSVNIHKTAIVSPKAILGENVQIGPFTIIEDDVVIGDSTIISANCYLDNGARIGSECKLFPGVVVATEPQDLKYAGEVTYAHVGDRTMLREYVTIHRGTSSTGKTVVGSDCMIMAYCHVAHDCTVGDRVIMSNVTQLAGHVVIEDWVILGGVTKIHQFCTVGRHSMVGADVKIVKDVAPYCLIGRDPAQVESINKVGLRRRGFSHELINEIEKFYDTLLFSGLNNRDGIAKFISERDNISEEVKYCIEFIEKSTRGTYR